MFVQHTIQNQLNYKFKGCIFIFGGDKNKIVYCYNTTNDELVHWNIEGQRVVQRVH